MILLFASLHDYKILLFTYHSISSGASAVELGRPFRLLKDGICTAKAYFEYAFRLKPRFTINLAME